LELTINSAIKLLAQQAGKCRSCPSHDLFSDWKTKQTNDSRRARLL